MQKAVSFSSTIRTNYPEPIAIAIARDKEGIYNPITLGWVMRTSLNPPMLAISVGLERHSYESIRHAGEFTICFPSETMIEAMKFYGSKSGRDHHKLKEFPTPFRTAESIDSVLLEEGCANFECTLSGELITGDHAVFAGKVLKSWVNEDEQSKRLYTLPKGQGFGGL